MQQKLIAQVAERYSSGAAPNAGSSEEYTDVQNADLLDRRGHLPDLFICSSNMLSVICVS
jgi:hypothetical protein